MKELQEILRLWQQHRGKPLALATLVRVLGSSYRRPGARMLIAANGATAGALSGGCLEEEVAARAQEVMRTGMPAVMVFDTRRRFGCNGTITVFVERVQEKFLAELRAELQQRRGCFAVTSFEPDADESGTRLLGENDAAPDHDFVQRIEPPIQLLLFGQGPDSTPIRAFAEMLGWTVREFHHAAELPTAADARTAAVVKSHNYGRDCAVLRQLLQLDLRYVGLLGPRRRRDQLLGDLLDSGVAIEAELFAPAGLDLAAETPEEIALSIVAEIQAVFADGSGEPLRERKAPIHGWNVARRAGAAAACELSAR